MAYRNSLGRARTRGPIEAGEVLNCASFYGIRKVSVRGEPRNQKAGVTGPASCAPLRRGGPRTARPLYRGRPRTTRGSRPTPSTLRFPTAVPGRGHSPSTAGLAWAAAHARVALTLALHLNRP